MDNFYLLDKRCGDIVTIDGKSAYDLFNADLKEKKSVPGTITADFQKALGASGISLMSYNIAIGGLEMTFYVGGRTRQECNLNTSNLVAACKNCILNIEDDEFEYVSILTKFTVSEKNVDFYNEVKLTFSVVKRLHLVRVDMTYQGGMFVNIGSVSSGMRIIVTPKQAITSMTLNGIKMENLAIGVPFVIDGIEGSVTADGKNRFLDTDLVEFPKAVPGRNEIKVSSEYDGIDFCSIAVEYYPTLII